MARFFVQLVAAERSEAHELHAGRPLVVGRALLADDAAAERHLTLTAHEDGVVVEELRGASGTTLNEVQLSGQTVARAGDEIGVGRSRLIVLAQSDPPNRTVRLGSHDELMARLDDELARAGLHRPVLLALVAMPPLNSPARQAMLRRLAEGIARLGARVSWAEFAADVVAGVIPELEAAARAELLVRLPAVAGPRARVAWAQSPLDGHEGEGLLEVALERLGASVDIERVVVDPAMVRLTEAAERLGRGPASVRLEGPSGSGRTSLARAMLGGEAKVIHALDSEGLAAARGQAVVVREAGLLDAAQVRALLAAGRVVATVGPGQHQALFSHCLKVPGLGDRPADILPLADSFLSAERRLLARPRLSLGVQARGLLGRYRWPGSVRELRNVMARAARAAVRDEIGPDALPGRLTQDVPAENLRGALKSTERELLLEALARTRWNVTAAAARLGLPRRTVVYRMARLGLKRPAR